MMTPVWLESTSPRSRVKYSTTEPLRSCLQFESLSLLEVTSNADVLNSWSTIVDMRIFLVYLY